MRRYTVLFDGSCGFCHFWVEWILKRDRRQIFNFASLQGHFGQAFLKEQGLDSEDLDTLYLVGLEGEHWGKSDAVLRIFRLLGGVYSLALVGNILPKFIRDRLYEAVAANRKKLMGTNCYVPTSEERKRFLP